MLYTDGVTEARRAGGLFGGRRLLDAGLRPGSGSARRSPKAWPTPRWPTVAGLRDRPASVGAANRPDGTRRPGPGQPRRSVASCKRSATERSAIHPLKDASTDHVVAYIRQRLANTFPAVSDAGVFSTCLTSRPGGRSRGWSSSTPLPRESTLALMLAQPVLEPGAQDDLAAYRAACSCRPCGRRPWGPCTTATRTDPSSSRGPRRFVMPPGSSASDRSGRSCLRPASPRERAPLRRCCAHRSRWSSRACRSANSPQERP